MKQSTKQAKQEKMWIDALERKLEAQGLEARNQALLLAQGLEASHELAIKLLQESADYEQALDAIENLETTENRFFERLTECLSLGFTSLDVWSVYYLTLAYYEKCRYRRDRIRPEDRIKNESACIHYTRLSFPLDLPKQIEQRRKQFAMDRQAENERLTKLLAPLVKTPTMDKFSAKYDDTSEYSSDKIALPSFGHYRALTEHKPLSPYVHTLLPDNYFD